ncbi:hypothetical protein FB451DRAFT_1399693 [Mycena latifolia]|nr:hypothetical protein FB451DRAFT_1399693 [Mycena latifolia]
MTNFQVNDPMREDPGTLKTGSAVRLAFQYNTFEPGFTFFSRRTPTQTSDSGVQEIEGLASQMPDNVVIGLGACLKCCGLKWRLQRTLPHGILAFEEASLRIEQLHNHQRVRPGRIASPIRHVIKVGATHLSFNLVEHLRGIRILTYSSFQTRAGSPLAQTSGLQVCIRPSTMDASFPKVDSPNCANLGILFSTNTVESEPNAFATFWQLARSSGNKSSVGDVYSEAVQHARASDLGHGDRNRVAVPTFAPSPVMYVEADADDLNVVSRQTSLWPGHRDLVHDKTTSRSVERPSPVQVPRSNLCNGRSRLQLLIRSSIYLGNIVARTTSVITTLDSASLESKDFRFPSAPSNALLFLPQAGARISRHMHQLLRF